MSSKKTNTGHSAPELTPRQKLGSLWRRLQCASLLGRYNISQKAGRGLSAAGAAAAAMPMAMWLGEWLYGIGFSTEYQFIRIGRAAERMALVLARFIHKFLRELLNTAFPGAKKVFHELFGPVYIFIRGMFRGVKSAANVRQEQGSGAAAHSIASFVRDGVAHNIARLPLMIMYILPLLALAGMLTLFRYVIGQPYVLAVQVNGITVGYVENEDVFNSARDDVQERINYSGSEEHHWTIEPSYTLSVARNVLTESEMADAILRASGDEISEGTALYLDGVLAAVCTDGSRLQSYLSSLLEPYEDPEDSSLSVSFNKDVRIESGIYFNDSFKPYEEIEAMLSSVSQQKLTYTVQQGDSISLIASKNGLTMRELCELNMDFTENGEDGLTQDSKIMPGDELTVTKEESMLEVRITRVETKQEEIPFDIETTKSGEYTIGMTKITQEGENGLRNVTQQNVYDTDGMLLEQTVISSEIIKEPVTRKVTVGTKKVTMSTAYITGSGQFIWPVPTYRYCSRWYGGSHKGVDICAPAGTPIYATASGTVSKAGYGGAGAGSGYGYSVIISHGGGYSSVYAHCISLTVSAGQYVKQGQLIGYVGSTGRSTGNHCHFEIRLNGSKLVIQNFFPSYR